MTNEELCNRIQSGDNDAVLELWKQSEPYITRAAKIFLNKRAGFFELEDLKQSGFIAMLRAAKDYTPEKETPFTVYLSYWLDSEFRLSDGITTRRRVKIQLDDGRIVETSAEPLRHAESLDRPNDKDDPDGDTRLSKIIDYHDQYAAADHRIFLEQLRETLEQQQRQGQTSGRFNNLSGAAWSSSGSRSTRTAWSSS